MWLNMKSLRINEIFKSIDGEGQYQGYPSIFIRLGGCNLRCSWCDTAYAFTEFAEKSVEEVLATVDELTERNHDFVIIITGGEPLVQKEGMLNLLKGLHKAGYRRILIYTNGTIDIAPFKRYANFVLDYKIQFKDKFLAHNINELRPNDILKFVVANEEELNYVRDFEWEDSTVYCGGMGAMYIVPLTIKLRDTKRFVVAMTPAFGLLTNQQMVEYMLDNSLTNIKLSLQIHKIIWDPAKRGV